MPFETLEDIIRALEQHPEWREPLLRALGLDRLYELPDQVAAMREENERRFARIEAVLAQLVDIVHRILDVAQETLEIQRGTLEMVRQLTQDMQQMIARQEQLEMRQIQFEQLLQRVTERQEQHDARQFQFEQLLQRMTERQEQFEQWLQRVTERQEQYDARQFQFEQLLQRMTERQEQFEQEMRQFAEQMLQLSERVSRLEEKYDRLVEEVASLKGIVLELKYRDRAASIFGRYLRKVQLASIDDLIDTLEAIKPLSEEELEELLRADAIFTAVRATTREPLYLVLEVSYVVDRGDVGRAIQRARVFQERGFKAVPAVGGEQATEGAKAAAERGEVLLALDGVIRGAAILDRTL
ncbi:Chromosome partition protein Smc [bacterium HR15]|nr:Chromosome partition protein Smc [bacterium HR15]